MKGLMSTKEITCWKVITKLILEFCLEQKYGLHFNAPRWHLSLTAGHPVWLRESPGHVPFPALSVPPANHHVPAEITWLPSEVCASYPPPTAHVSNVTMAHTYPQIFGVWKPDHILSSARGFVLSCPPCLPETGTVNEPGCCIINLVW